MLKAKKILSIALACAIIFNVFAIGASAVLNDGQALSAAINLEVGTYEGGEWVALPAGKALKTNDEITVRINPQSDFYCGASRYVVMFSKEYFEVVGTDQDAFAANANNLFYQLAVSSFSGTTSVPVEGWPATLVANGDYNTYSAISVYNSANHNSSNQGHPYYLPGDEWLFSFNLKVTQDIPANANARIWMDKSWFRTPADTGATAFFVKCENDSQLSATGSSTIYNFDINTTGADLDLSPVAAQTSTITFDSNDGSAVASITGDVGTSVAKPADPSKTNYNFSGWYKDAALSQSVTWPYTLTASNVKFYAKWTIKKTSITYNSNGGTSVSSSSGDIGSSVTKPANPTKANYTFENWYSNSGLTQLVTWPYTRTALNVNFYAKWVANTSTITYDSNGGSAVALSTGNVGASVTKPTNPTKENYTFVDWYSDSALTQVVPWPYTRTTSNVTFYAKWTINTSTITFVSNGGSSVSPITGNIGDSIQKPADPTKTDNIFAGWYSDEALTQPVTWPFTLPATNVTFYAKWTATSTITFNSASGSSVASITLPEGSAVTKPLDPTRDGYKFLGWIPAVPVAMTVDNMICVAQWGQLSTITFVSNNGTAVDPITDVVNTSIAKPTDPTLTNYTFAGWYTDVGLTQAVEWNYTLTATSVTFYAKWTENVTTSTIIFDSKGGTAVASITDNIGSSVNAPVAPTRAGYTFKGWYSDAALTQAVVWPYTLTKDNVIFYAKWEINTITITFDTRGGSYIAPIEVHQGDILNDLPVPTKAGNVFVGWYTDSELNWPLTLPFTVISNDITLYAKWEATYTITFNSNGGSDVGSITDVVGKQVSAPTAPTKTDYTFVGWFTDEGLTNAVTWSYTLESNVTFYAKWVESSSVSTITFVTGNGTPIAAITGNVGDPVPVVKDPTCLDYAFFGWSTALPATFPAENLTVTAKWKQLGDINFDGKVNSTDVRMALKAGASTLDLTYDQNKVADVDHNGKINSTDVRMILKYAAGTLLHFPEWPAI